MFISSRLCAPRKKIKRESEQKGRRAFASKALFVYTR